MESQSSSYQFGMKPGDGQGAAGRIVFLSGKVFNCIKASDDIKVVKTHQRVSH